MLSPDDLAHQVLAVFFQSPRKPGDLFWSVREISQQFDCTEYTALEILKKLTVERYIKRVPGKGSFLEDRVDMKFLSLTRARPHIGIVPPRWSDASAENVWTDYLKIATAEARRRKWDVTVFSGFTNWSQIDFQVRFKLSGCNILIVRDPTDDAVVTLAGFRRDSIPVLVVGRRLAAYDQLGISTIGCDEAEIMKTVVLHLFNVRGVKHPLMLAYGPGPAIVERRKGAAEAYKQVGLVMPYDVFLDGPDDQALLLQYMKDQLEGPHAPDAIICHESAILEYALTHWPGLKTLIKRRRIPVAVFDGLHTAAKWPSLKMIVVESSAEELSLRSMELAGRLLNAQTVPKQTVIGHSISWDEPKPVPPPARPKPRRK